MQDMSCSQFSAVGSRFKSSSLLWIVSAGVVLLYVGSKLGSNLSRGFAYLLLLFEYDALVGIGFDVKPTEDSSRFDSVVFFA